MTKKYIIHFKLAGGPHVLSLIGSTYLRVIQQSIKQSLIEVIDQ